MHTKARWVEADCEHGRQLTHDGDAQQGLEVLNVRSRAGQKMHQKARKVKQSRAGGRVGDAPEGEECEAD